MTPKEIAYIIVIVAIVLLIPLIYLTTIGALHLPSSTVAAFKKPHVYAQKLLKDDNGVRRSVKLWHFPVTGIAAAAAAAAAIGGAAFIQFAPGL